MARASVAFPCSYGASPNLVGKTTVANKHQAGSAVIRDGSPHASERVDENQCVIAFHLADREGGGVRKRSRRKGEAYFG